MDRTEPEGSKGIILVVDDQPMILKLVQTILDGVGLDIVPVDHPGQAVRLARKHRERIRLLITDLNLGSMSGGDLAGKVLEHCPGLRVLVMYGERSNDLNFAAAARHDFIGKPFSPAELTRRVETLLAN
jgi:DNA-binding NtrC family response regulator